MTEPTDTHTEAADDTNRQTPTDDTGCDACEESHHDDYFPVDIAGAEYTVCDGCREHLREEIEAHHWFDKLSEERYHAAADYLRGLDEVWCVKDAAYEAGELWVHTPYCSAKVVGDVMDHFGFHIYSFGHATPAEDDAFDCMHDHGECIEILLTYTSSSARPLPPEADLTEFTSDTEWLDESDKLFEA